MKDLEDGAGLHRPPIDRWASSSRLRKSVKVRRVFPERVADGYRPARHAHVDDRTAGQLFLRDVKRPVIMLAGGTGAAPILSMLEVLAEDGLGQKLHLIYGVTKDGDMAAAKRIQALPGVFRR